jgi:hypothetical protein
MSQESSDRPARSPVSIGPAPADARQHAPWPAWKKVLAYAVLAALAAGAIWYVDLKAHRPDGGKHPAAPLRYAGACGACSGGGCVREGRAGPLRRDVHHRPVPNVIAPTSACVNVAHITPAGSS